MFNSLRPMQNRLLALSLLGLAVLIVGLLIFLPYKVLYDHYKQPLTALVDQVHRSERIVRGRGGVQQALDEINANAAGQYYLTNNVVSLAASEIQEILKGLLDKKKAQLQTLQVVSPQEEDGYRRITVRVQFVSDMNALAEVLYSIEAMQPFLLLDNLTIKSRVDNRYKAKAGVQPELTVAFDLFGYALIVDQAS